MIGDEEQNEKILEQLITEIVGFGKTPAIIFVRTKEHVQELTRQLNKKIPNGFIGVTGEVREVDRDRYAQELDQGKYYGAICTTVWSTGIDIPNLRMVVLMDGIESPIPIIQESGRAARKKEGMEFEILVIGKRQKTKTVIDNLGKAGYNSNEINIIGDTCEEEWDPTPGCLSWALFDQFPGFGLLCVIIYFLLEHF